MQKTWTGAWIIRPSIFTSPNPISGEMTVNAADADLARLSIQEEAVRSELGLMTGTTVKLFSQMVHVFHLHEIPA